MAFLPLELLASGALELDLELSSAQLEQFDEFARMLVEANRKHNLTRITDPHDIVTRHYLDSLTCLSAREIDRGSKVIDVGTGAGFPGIPMAIARNDLKLTLLDSLRKRLTFLEEAARELGLTNVEMVHARAEDAGRDRAHREVFDVAVTRALSRVKVIVELCLPLVKVGGCLIVQKSKDVEDELDEARAMMGQLGGRLAEVARLTIPHTDIKRCLVIVEKVKPTPEGFPRPWGRIADGKRV